MLTALAFISVSRHIPLQLLMDISKNFSFWR
jgi:hypothetical protein